MTSTNGWWVDHLNIGSMSHFANLSIGSVSQDSSGWELPSKRPGAELSLSQSGNDIYLNHTAVPMTASVKTAALGCFMVKIALLRQSRREAASKIEGC